MQLGKTPKIFGLADLAVGRVIREGFRPSSGVGRADGPEPTSAALSAAPCQHRQHHQHCRQYQLSGQMPVMNC